MSYILDALRKTERERQQAEPLIMNPIAAEGVELPRRRLGFAVGTAVALFAVVAFGAYWWMLVTGRTPAVPAVAAPASALHESPPTNAVGVATADKKPDSVSKAVRRAPEFKQSPFVPPRRSAAIRDLANEARVDRSPPPKVDAPATATRPVTAKVEAPANSTPISLPSDDSIKFLRAMPPEFRRGLPQLAVTIHIYASRPADCILYINNRQYHVGERVGDGVVVKEIVPDGVVLSYHGQLFKLPRPT